MLLWQPTRMSPASARPLMRAVQLQASMRTPSPTAAANVRRALASSPARTSASTRVAYVTALARRPWQHTTELYSQTVSPHKSLPVLQPASVPLHTHMVWRCVCSKGGVTVKTRRTNVH